MRLTTGAGWHWRERDKVFREQRLEFLSFQSMLILDGPQALFHQETEWFRSSSSLLDVVSSLQSEFIFVSFIQSRPNSRRPPRPRAWVPGAQGQAESPKQADPKNEKFHLRSASARDVLEPQGRL